MGIPMRREGIISGEEWVVGRVEQNKRPIMVPRATPAAQEAEKTKTKTKAKGGEGEIEWGDREGRKKVRSHYYPRVYGSNWAPGVTCCHIFRVSNLER